MDFTFYDFSGEKAKALVSNTDYILWLEKFTIANPHFNTNTWLYCPNEISKEDSEKVDNLSDFFSGIEEYANRYFFPTESNFSNRYIFVKFNNIGYMIGRTYIQGGWVYCKRVDISSDNVFIDFNDVMDNKNQENIDYIHEKLDSLSSIIKDLLKIGVPAKAISTRVKNTLNNKDTQKT